MNILFFDTSVPIGMVGLKCNDEPAIHHIAESPLSQSRDLSATIARLLESKALRPRDLDVIGLLVGPGSYTGLRIGVGCALGLSLGSRTQFALVNSFELQWMAAGQPNSVAIAIHARQQEWYLSSRVGETISEPVLVEQNHVADFLDNHRQTILLVDKKQPLIENGGSRFEFKCPISTSKDRLKYFEQSCVYAIDNQKLAPRTSVLPYYVRAPYILT